MFGLVIREPVTTTSSTSSSESCAIEKGTKVKANSGNNKNRNLSIILPSKIRIVD